MKFVSAFLQVFLFGLAIYISFVSLQPSINPSPTITEFSSENAFVHVQELAKSPHFTGTKEHALTRNYILSELEKLSLEAHVQQGFSTTNSSGLSIAIPENIVAKMEGLNPEEPALVLLSHYDSAVHSSYGAADAASGVAAILEATRAFLAQEKQPLQDIILLFSDTEEVGLNGASLFVNEHPWAKNIGLVLNFEARGTSGPSSTLLEVNGGNKELITHLEAASVPNVFANSLMYSVYKLLPNSTDSTVFREEGNIPSYFFAFIDQHFYYHTAKDIPENLSVESLNQQGIYALSLLNYFSTKSLNDMVSDKDDVYFNFPFLGIIHFSQSTALFFIVFCFILFFALIVFGIRRRTIELRKLLKGFLFSIASLGIAFLVGFYGWKLIQYLYPSYQLILHGYPYNGLSYTVAFVCFMLALYLVFFAFLGKRWDAIHLLPSGIFIWLVISLSAFIYLPGASYFFIPAAFALLSLLLLVFNVNQQFVHFIFSLPLLFMFAPLVHFFPVGLGLSFIFIATVFVVLILLLLSPLLFTYKALKGLRFMLFCTALFFLGRAHINADFTSDQPRPSSLIYCFDTTSQMSFWGSYEKDLSKWNASFFSKEVKNANEINFESKYESKLYHMASAPMVTFEKPIIQVEKITTPNSVRRFKLYVKPNRLVHRYEAFFSEGVDFFEVVVNGKKVSSWYEKEAKGSVRFFNYYVTNQEALEIEFSVTNQSEFQLTLYESAFDLINHPLLKVPPRPTNEMPMPFVLNDATIVTYTIPFHE